MDGREERLGTGSVQSSVVEPGIEIILGGSIGGLPLVDCAKSLGCQNEVGSILEPQEGDRVSFTSSVLARVEIPEVVAAVVVRPAKEGRYWVQRPTYVPIPSEVRLEASFGGVDSYQLYVGLSHDVDFFEEGAALTELPRSGDGGQLLHLIGPLNVCHRNQEQCP
ncbi:MAG: hypothetical protein AAGF23_04685 [Acidobacteriota bacterium]